MIALTALACAALFAGTALSASLGAASTRRLSILQHLFAVAGGLLAAAAWYRWRSNIFWLSGSVILLASLALALLPKSERVDHLRTALGLLATGLLWYGLAG